MDVCSLSKFSQDCIKPVLTGLAQEVGVANDMLKFGIKSIKKFRNTYWRVLRHLRADSLNYKL